MKIWSKYVEMVFYNQYQYRVLISQDTVSTRYRWSISDKRVLTTHVVATAWIQFCIDKRDMICKAFRDVGITLPVDGSQDSKLAIKGIDSADISIGDGGKDPTTAELDKFYRFIPINGDDTDALEYTWALEDYVHTEYLPEFENKQLTDTP